MLLEEARTKRAEEAERKAMLAQQHDDADSISDVAKSVDVALYGDESEKTLAAATYASNRSEGVHNPVYIVSDPLEVVATPDPDAFFDSSYDHTLMNMVAHVVEVEAPIREDLLAKRIARAHGWTRTGVRIRDRVLRVAKKSFAVTKEDVGLFVWPASSAGELWSEFRRPDSEDPRTVDEIAMPELVALAKEVSKSGLIGEDVLTTMAREAGLKKLRANSRERLESALAMVEAVDPVSL